MADFPLEFLLQVKNEMGAGLTQATSQLKSMGSEAASSASKVKASGLGIGASISLITTQLVSTANSIINLKRQWEDLTRSQNNVVQSGYTLASAKGNLENATIKLGKAVAGTAGASENEIKIAKLQFKEDMKNADSKLDVMKAHEKLNKVMNQGGKDAGKIAIATNNLERAKRRVASASINEKEAQQNLKRAYEDFYLSTIPTAIGIFGSFATMIATFQTSGGLQGIGTSLLKFSPILIGLAAGFLALKTNFLGITTFFQNLGRDIGNAIPALKPFLELIEALFAAIGIGPKKAGINKAIEGIQKGLQPILDTFKNLIDSIMKGNWEGVFKVIINAAKSAWIELKKAFPIFGEIESLVNKIKGGQWKGALLQIWAAAVSVWGTIKKSVPFLGDIEAFIRSIAAGKWGEAWTAIKSAIENSGIKQAINKAFGIGEGETDVFTKFITQLQQLPEKIKNTLSQQKFDKKNANPFAGMGIIDQIIGLDNWSAAGFIEAFKLKLTEGFKIGSWWGDDPNPPGKQMLDGFFASANAWITTSIDGFVASLFDPKSWLIAIETQLVSFQAGVGNIIQLIMDALFGQKDAKTGKNPQIENNAQLIGQAIVEGIGNWFKDVMPKSAQALSTVTAFWASLGTTFKANVTSAITIATNIGNGIINGITTFFTPEGFAKVVTKMFTALRSAVNAAKDVLADLGAYIWGRIWNSITGAAGAALGGLGWIGNELKKIMGLTRAAGFHGLVTGPTTFTAGEQGAEQVDITTRADMMTKKKQGGTGTITVVVPVMLNGRQIAEVVAKEISSNQSTYR